MLSEFRGRTAPKQLSLREELRSTAQFIFAAMSVSLVLFILLSVSPYLIDSKCSQPGYMPVTLAECLPRSEVRSTIWEVSIPSPLGDIYLVKGEPIAQVLPLFFPLCVLAYSAVSAASLLGRAVFSNLASLPSESEETSAEK